MDRFDCISLNALILCVVGKELCAGRSAFGHAERVPAAGEASHAKSAISGSNTAAADTTATATIQYPATIATTATATSANGSVTALQSPIL